MRISPLIVAAVTWVMSVSAFAAVPRKMNAFAEGERVVYARVVEAYRKGQLEEVHKQRKLLERHYPSSVFLDNALYMSGMLEFQNNRIGEAVRTFSRVREEYPKSNKRPAALFGLAMSYKRLGLNPQATRILSSIMKEYPGSPEAQRARMHMRVERTGSVKR